ncbi:MAG: hypothetical protein HRU03_06415 [Nanoarchaeales archaeon]|nr:hypothetical protein [Nanoarchaeales archaeon]
MTRYNSRLVRENTHYKTTTDIFRNLLNSSSLNISENDKKLINYLPYFISLAHPYIFFEGNHTDKEDFGGRKISEIPYARHPLRMCILLLKSGITDVKTLFTAAFHDNPEELIALNRELKKQNIEGFLKHFDTAEQYMEDILFPNMGRVFKNEGLFLPTDFYADVSENVKILTPSSNPFLDLNSLVAGSVPYKVKLPDSLDGISDTGFLNCLYNVNSRKYISNIDERNSVSKNILWKKHNKIDILYAKGDSFYTKNSNEGKLVDKLLEGMDFIEDIISMVDSQNPTIVMDLAVYSKQVELNHSKFMNFLN